MSATAGSHDSRPRAPDNPFSPVPGGSQRRRPSATSRPRCRLHEHTALHATRFWFLPFFSFALRFNRVPPHTGNHAFTSRFFQITPCIRSFRFFAPLPTHSDLCSSADRCTRKPMHSYPHRTPQHTISPSFDHQHTSRMVREPHRTHDNKTRLCSFTVSRTTICAPFFPPTPTYTVSHLVFPFPFHTVAQISPHSNAPPPGHTCQGVTPGPCMSHLHRFPPTTFTILTCLSPSSLSFFRLHPTSPAPRPHRPPASCRRVSNHLFPRAYLRVPVI